MRAISFATNMPSPSSDAHSARRTAAPDGRTGTRLRSPGLWDITRTAAESTCAERINRLIGIAYYEQPAVRARPFADEIVLHGIDILKLVHMQPAESSALSFEREPHEIVVVRGAGIAQPAAVFGNRGGFFAAAVLICGYGSEETPGRAAQSELTHDFRGEPELCGTVGQRRARKHRITDRVEGADCNLVGVLYARTQPRTHFFGGADGKRDGAYVAGIHAPFDQPCDAFGKRKRFARARSGYHGGDARVAVRSRGLRSVYAFCGRGALFAGIRR